MFNCRDENARQKTASRGRRKERRIISSVWQMQEIAKVDSKGKVKGLKKGKATIYVFAQNGVCSKVKVVVK